MSSMSNSSMGDSSDDEQSLEDLAGEPGYHLHSVTRDLEMIDETHLTARNQQRLTDIREAVADLQDALACSGTENSTSCP